ncbi:cupin domain-containing protein [Bacillus sp. RD4P76]|uniref:Cupin domain-containing protein n=2 Tax=Bacillus suaedaesalsae TaxID=2810349 RepID=A0ABS2DHJ1_9BACI|nr:cupin domain-containing protein [Bacillus suaedaesalsae]MBM6617877.1 cupin domain-containing protein [Bacillus suaedaesalsae]
MYDDSLTNSYPYYPTYSNSMYRYDQPLIDAVVDGIKKEASSIELYTRLAHTAPNESHQQHILYALERNKVQYSQLHSLYVQLTGTHPQFQHEQIHYQNYRDGLEKAYQTEVAGYDLYQKSCLLTKNPQVQNMFIWALNNERDNAMRFEALLQLKDYGDAPFVIDIEEATKQNDTFRTALWTGSHLQLTLMSIGVGEDIGLEIHPDLDQFLRIEQGQGVVKMGDSREQLTFEEKIYDDFAIIIPAVKWHNLINTGNEPLKLYSIYAPPQHPFGTVHKTKADALAAEAEEGN